MEIENPTQNTKNRIFFDIQAEGCVKINSDYVIVLKKEEKNWLLPKKKKNCKVLKFSYEWTFKDVLNEIRKLNPDDYQNLFVFIIDVKNYLDDGTYDEQNISKRSDTRMTQYVKKVLEETFVKFLESHQIVIQLTSENENETKLYFNQANSMKKLHEVRKEANEGVSGDGFSSFFLDFINLQQESPEKFEDAIFDKLKNPEQLSLRFLTLFNFSIDFVFRIASYCAANLPKTHFLMAMGLMKEENLLTKNQAKIVSTVFEGQENPSILEAALARNDREIVDYLIGSGVYRIVPLPGNQKEISNKLIKSGEHKKINILCDLLKSYDFMFPDIIALADLKHDRFNKIISDRKEFYEAIETENYENILKFKRNYPNLVIAYNFNNESALYTAAKTGKFDSFRYLKEKGFIDEEKHPDDIRCELMMQNIELNSCNPRSAPVNFLVSRSRIFGEETDHSEKIKKWLEAIYETELGRPLINAVAECDNLQIIFDFRRTNVEGVDLDSRDSNGIFYQEKDLVIVAAKYSSEDKEQIVKGVLAHELTHFLILKMFQNDCNPYLNEEDQRYKDYKKIVKKYENEHPKNKYTDDGCEGIISSVYQSYEEDDYDAELIVRAFQIHARYDTDRTKIGELEGKYKDLFDFANDLVHLMENLNMKGKEVVNSFNKYAGLLPIIRKLKFKFPACDAIKKLLHNRPAIITTNVPKLFLSDVYSQLCQVNGNLAGTRNIFLARDKLFDQDFLKDLNMIIEKVKEVNFFIDLSVDEIIHLPETLDIPSDRNFIFCVSNDKMSSDLMEILKQKGLNPYQESTPVNYEWTTLPKNVQGFFLNKKLIFQKNSQVSLSKLFGWSCDLSTVMDVEMINMMLNNEEIPINSNISIAKNENDYFVHLNFERRFCVNYQRKGDYSQQDLINMNKKSKFVLISDLAGSGKSWAMRNLALEMSRQANNDAWVSYVDLKLYTSCFRNWNEEVNMDNFMVKEILQNMTNLEKKIFKMKYLKGKVVIFFDGFDEIADYNPNCTNLIVNMMKSFKVIPGNQLFVSTRDYFEEGLKKELEVKDTYKLDLFDKFDNERGIELIARIWRLHDLKGSGNFHLSDGLEKYKKPARKLIKNYSMDSFDFQCGSPQILSMIASLTKEKKELDKSFNTYQLYDELWNRIRKEWEDKKGPARAIEGKESQRKDLNFLKLHELLAMKRFAPGLSSYCGLDPDSIQLEWSNDSSIDGCGLLTKKDDDFFFNHKTFYEFFVAEFILSNLRYPNRANDTMEFMERALFVENYVIRKFLDEGLYNEKLREKTSNGLNIFDSRKKIRLRKLAENISSVFEENIFYIFVTKLVNHDTLSDFLIEIFKMAGDGKLKEIIRKEVIDEIKMNQKAGPEWSQETFIDLILTRIDIKTIIDIAEELNSSEDPMFVKRLIQNNDVKENIFHTLIRSNISKNEQFDKFLESLKKFLSLDEIAEKMKECNEYGKTVFHLCLDNEIHKLSIFMEGFQKFFETNFSYDDYKNILKSPEQSTFLHESSSQGNTDIFYDYLWNILVEAFKSHKDVLMELTVQLDSEGRNCLHILKAKYNPKKSCGLKIALEKLKSGLGRDQFRTILTSKTQYSNENLLCYLYNFETDKVLWAFLNDCIDTKEQLLEVLTDADKYGNNYFRCILSNLSCGEYFLKHLNTIKEDTIRNVDWFKSIIYEVEPNFLENLLLFNTGFNSYRNVMIALRKYFSSTEIFNFLNQRDIFGLNYQLISMLNAERLLVEMTITKIMEEIRKYKLIEEDKNIQKRGIEYSSKFNYEYQRPRVYLKELKELNIYDGHFFHQLGVRRMINYIEPFFEMIDDKLDGPVLEIILKAEDHGLFQIVAYHGRKLSVYKYLWKLIQRKIDAETLLSILRHNKNKEGNNFLMNFAAFGTEEYVKFTWDQIEEYKVNNITEIIKERNLMNENILQLAAGGRSCTFIFVLSKVKKYISDLKKYVMQINDKGYEPTILFRHTHCNNKNCHKALWDILMNELDREELKKFVTYESNYNFLDKLAEEKSNSSVGVEYIFDKLREIFIETGDFSLAGQVLKNSKAAEDLKIFNHVLRNYEFFKDTKNMITETDSNGWNTLHYAARYASSDVINTLHEGLKDFKEESEANENIIKSSIMKDNEEGKNLMMTAGKYNKNKKSHVSLWKLICNFLKDEEIMTLINRNTESNPNVLQTAVEFNTTEVVEFTWNQIKTFQKTTGERLKYLERTFKHSRLVDLAAMNKKDGDKMRGLVKSIIYEEMLQETSSNFTCRLSED